jgi:transcriptional regulator with XRE-family HTH domain
VPDSEDSVYQRLNFIVDTLEGGNQAEFARRIGVRSGVIGDMFGKRRNKPSFDVLAKIAAAYPQLRVEWLLLGEGSMLKSEQSQSKGVLTTMQSKGDLERMVQEIVSAQIARGQIDGQIASNRAKQLQQLVAEEHILLETLQNIKEQAKSLRATSIEEAANLSEAAKFTLGVLEDDYDMIRAELRAISRSRMTLNEIHSAANQEAQSMVYRIQGEPEPNKPFGGLLSYRLGIAESSAIQLVTAGKIRSVEIEDEGYRVTELAVREFLGEA